MYALISAEVERIVAGFINDVEEAKALGCDTPTPSDLAKRLERFLKTIPLGTAYLNEVSMMAGKRLYVYEATGK